MKYERGGFGLLPVMIGNNTRYCLCMGEEYNACALPVPRDVTRNDSFTVNATEQKVHNIQCESKNPP